MPTSMYKGGDLPRRTGICCVKCPCPVWMVQTSRGQKAAKRWSPSIFASEELFNTFLTEAGFARRCRWQKKSTTEVPDRCLPGDADRRCDRTARLRPSVYNDAICWPDLLLAMKALRQKFGIDENSVRRDSLKRVIPDPPSALQAGIVDSWERSDDRPAWQRSSAVAEQVRRSSAL